MKTITLNSRALVRAIAAAVLALILALPSLSAAQTVPTFHFESICRSDPAAKKNTVTLILHDDSHWPLADVTIQRALELRGLPTKPRGF